MSSFLVDPAARAVTAVEIEGDFLDAVRREIGATQIDVVAVADHRFAVWVDAMGLLRPGRDFWRFSDADHRFAGRCLITGLSPEGLPIAFPEQATAAEVQANVVFHPSDDLERIDERIVLVANEHGRPVPVVARTIIWKRQEAEPAAPGSGWTVFERAAGGYRAILYEMSDDRLEAVGMVSAPNLDELHKLLPAGLVRREPGELDDEEVVEHWLAPSAPVPD